MKVLVAEDDVTSRSILKSVLEDWDYEVVIAHNGSEALEKLTGPDPPKLAVLDWVMPEMDGLTVCRKIRVLENDEPPYIIFLTTRDEISDIVHGLDAGANDYIGKPFDNQELHARIRVGERVVELQAALRERIRSLVDAAAHIKTLQGIHPICMHCHKIHTDEKTWDRIEKYISEHSDAQFSHSLCPECLHTYYSKYVVDADGGEVDS